MPKKGRSFSEANILPEFSATERFCYFLDLYTSSQGLNTSLARHKRQLANAANHNLLAPIRASLAINANHKDDTITSAINFLTKVAASERAKEIFVIKRYINDLKKNPTIVSILQSQGKNRDDLTNLIQDLENFSNNPSNGIAMKNYYSKLTLLINTIKNSAESYQTRLNQLLTKNRESTRDIRQDFYATRTAGDIDTLMRNLTGTVQREKESALSTRIINLLIKYIDNNLNINTTFLEHPISTLIALLMEFEKFLQTQHDLSNIVKLEDMDIEQIFLNYTNQTDTFLNLVQQNNQQALLILQSIESEMGFKELRPKTKEFEARQAVLDKLSNPKSKHSTNPRTRQAINKILKRAGQTEISNYLSWNVTTAKNNRHGTIYELIIETVEKGLKISGHAATDIISVDIGTINVDINLQNLLQNTAMSIKNTIEEEAKLQRDNRKSDLTNAIKEMNTSIQTTINDLNTILKDNKLPEDLFIYHESLKLYTQVEEHKVSEFHGREMQALNLLDNLYSINNMSDLKLVNESIMRGAILNLSSLAIGANAKPLIENYLSIFAGMLMFDDLGVMANDIARTSIEQTNNFGQAYNIHLYLVNDLYIPGSLVLTTIAQALTTGYQKLSSQQAAKIIIDTSGADTTIAQHLAMPYYGVDEWNDAAEEIAQGTKIEIIFLSAFFSFLSELQSYFS